jgi:effector-binding domain-containing protein
MMRKFWIVIAVAAVFFCGIQVMSQAQTPIQKPNPVMVVDTEPSIGPMRVRQLPGFSFLYVTRNTTIAGIGNVSNAELPKLFAALKAHGIVPVGPIVFIYHNANGDPKQNFSLDIGIEVADATAAPEGYQLKHEAAAHCATVLYGGSAANLKKGYQELFTNLSTRDLIPTGETREYYLSWDDDQSPNNVILIAACAE